MTMLLSLGTLLPAAASLAAVMTAALTTTVTAVLTVASIQNIWQTNTILTKFDFDDDDDDNIGSKGDVVVVADKSSSSSSSSSSATSSTTATTSLTSSPSRHNDCSRRHHPFGWTTPDDCWKDLQSMNREELLELFLSCPAPTSLDELPGEWKGCLLDNNGWVMTSVTAFLTNRLFAGTKGIGRSMYWNGKVFGSVLPSEPMGTTPATMMSGVNRFQWRPKGWQQQQQQQLPHNVSSSSSRFDSNDDDNDYRSEYQQHCFDVTVTTSAFQPHCQSLRISYSKYQSPWSLWKIMTDELRVIPIVSIEEGEEGAIARQGVRVVDKSNKKNKDGATTTLQQQKQATQYPMILIGMGCMSWSGGKWNASPFCLMRERASESKG